jgi:hypothetical protein
VVGGADGDKLLLIVTCVLVVLLGVAPQLFLHNV